MLPAAKDDNLLNWLMGNGGPVIRYLTARDLMEAASARELARLRKEVIAMEDTRKWLGLLGTGPIHSSLDSAFENCMGKLAEYGLGAGVRELDTRAKPYLTLQAERPEHWERWIIVSFLARAGYHEVPEVKTCLDHLITTAHQAAVRADYDVAMTREDRMKLPPSQRGKSYFKPEFSPMSGKYRLPTCYDLHAFAYCRAKGVRKRQIEDIVTYLIDERLQEQRVGYIWDAKLRCRYACSFARLPIPWDVNAIRPKPGVLVLYVEMMVNFSTGRSSAWFRAALEHLEQFRTERGTYCFPKEYLPEKKNSYYLYRGAHMGLGERTRNRKALELESTFRMLRIRKRGVPL